MNAYLEFLKKKKKIVYTFAPLNSKSWLRPWINLSKGMDQLYSH